MRKRHGQPPIIASPPTGETLRLLIAIPTPRCPPLPSPRLERPKNRCINIEAMRALDALCWTRRWMVGKTH